MFGLLNYTTYPAIVTEEGKIYTYGCLNKVAIELSKYIRKKTLVFCLCENTIGSLVGYISFINNHIPTVLLDGSKDLNMILNLINIYSPKYIWVSNHRKHEFSEGRDVYTNEDYSLLEFNVSDCEIDHELLLMLTTSGSTGSPKLVRLSYANVLSNAESIADYLNITSEERPITSLPMYYSYGLSVINSHLIKGATILLTNKPVVQKEFWTFAKEQKATSIAGVPYTYEVLKRLRIFRMNLPHLRTMTQAGGKLNAAIVKEYVEQAEASGKRFIVMYGQTEATARMSYLPWEKTGEKYSSIGIAIPGGKFSLIDENKNEITTPGIDGELVYAGPNVSMGYAECREDLAKGDENHGVLHTGDIARRDEEGFYYITGRLKRFVKVWGNRCNLDATEQFVKAITTNCACAGVDDKITIFVTEEGWDGKIKSLLSEKMGLNVRAFAVKVINAIPKNDSGKIQYAELQKMLD